jgi:trans-2-enoyl-CoA reductase
MKAIEDRIVDAIVRDFTDRRGLRQEWEQINEDIQAEIKATWKKIVKREMAKE